MDEKIRKLLYRSFDHTLKPAESTRLEEALQSSKDLREEKQRLERIRRGAGSLNSNQFDSGFTDRVMRRVGQAQSVREEDFFEALIAVFRPISVGVAVVILLLMTFNFLESREVSLSAALGQPVITLDEAVDPTLILAME